MDKGKSKRNPIDMNTIEVPLRFNIIWKNVSDIRQWILRHRNTQAMDKVVDINTYLMNISKEDILTLTVSIEALSFDSFKLKSI